ncbi:MAG: Crp/Fnr family transcriptional regulator [Bacteroidales bacterium]|nr:Crp/Fnr family transcriptional regulator [Bacteroidales bacterium]
MKNEELLMPCNKKCDFCFINYSNALSTIPIFKNIEEYEVKQIIRTTHHQVKSYSKNDVILQSGDNCNFLYIIVKGTVSAEMIELSGKTLRVETISAPNTIATAFIFGDDANCPVTVTAHDDVKIMLFHKSELLLLFQKNTTVLINYLDIVSNRARFMAEKIKQLSFKTIKSKLAHYILSISKNKNSFVFDKTQQELAFHFGVERPSIARVLSDMKEEKIITITNKKCTILNISALKEMLDS